MAVRPYDAELWLYSGEKLRPSKAGPVRSTGLEARDFSRVSFTYWQMNSEKKDIQIRMRKRVYVVLEDDIWLVVSN